MLEFIIVLVKIFVVIRCVYSMSVLSDAMFAIYEYIDKELVPEGKFDINIDYWDNMKIGYTTYTLKIWRWKKIDAFKKEYKTLMKQYI